MTVKEYLESVVNIHSVSGMRGDRPYSSIHDFILQNGSDHKPQVFDESAFPHSMRTPRNCYQNAWYLAEMHDLIYVEGMAFNLIFANHAWCIDKDMNVYDPTWKTPETSLYYGVAFDDEYVMEVLHMTGVYGIIDNPIQRFPLITGEHIDFKHKLCLKK